MSFTITMSQKELHRLEVIQKIRDRRLSVVQAAELLGLTHKGLLVPRGLGLLYWNSAVPNLEPTYIPLLCRRAQGLHANYHAALSYPHVSDDLVTKKEQAVALVSGFEAKDGCAFYRYQKAPLPKHQISAEPADAAEAVFRRANFGTPIDNQRSFRSASGPRLAAGWRPSLARL